MKAASFVVLLFTATSLLASPWGATRKGIKEYKKENYEGALENFQKAQLDDPVSPIVNLNIATSLYKQKKYDRAIMAYQKAAEKAEDPRLLSKIWYGMGNAYFQSDSLLRAIECFKKAVDYNPEDKDAKYNLELARALLKELAKKEEQPQQQATGGQSQKEQNVPRPDSTRADSTKNNQAQSAGKEKKENEDARQQREQALNRIEQMDKDQQRQRELPIRGRTQHEKDW
jgi:tetratricopeptide (TPR) repeat protein